MFMQKKNMLYTCWGESDIKEENVEDGASVGNGFDTSFNKEDTKLVEDTYITCMDSTLYFSKHVCVKTSPHLTRLLH